jgi:hypothetical protein
MDRRAFLGSTLGSAALGLSPAAAVTATGDRPSFAITSDGLDRWRVRSWEWHDGTWRPSIARLIRMDSRFRLDGRIAAADRPALAEWVEAQQSA